MDMFCLVRLHARTAIADGVSPELVRETIQRAGLYCQLRPLQIDRPSDPLRDMDLYRACGNAIELLDWLSERSRG